jgi:hypothetical protein
MSVKIIANAILRSWGIFGALARFLLYSLYLIEDMSYAGSTQKTVVLEGVGSIMEALQGLYSRVGNRCDRYEITSGIPLMTQSNKIKELLFNLRKRGVRIRQITEITKDNVIYCKQLMEIVELRHLEHVRGGMELNDDELIVTGNPEDPQTIAYLSKDTGSSTRTNATSSPQVIFSNVKQLVEQQQFIFDLLWSKAIYNNTVPVYGLG